MLPRFENHATLNESLIDRGGLRINFSYSENEHEMGKHQVQNLKGILETTVVYCSNTLDIPGASVHEVGSARKGLDPEHSVLNKHNGCWDLKNLIVTDGAASTTSGHQNPTLTILALTARACDNILAGIGREPKCPAA